MSSNFLQLHEDRILREQVRFVLGNVSGALIPTLAMSALIVWALSSTTPLATLLTWWLALIASRVAGVLHARRHLANDARLAAPRPVVMRLLVLSAMDGAAWGALAPITLNRATEAGVVLVVSSCAGLLGASVSRLAAIPAVYFAFCVPLLALLAREVWLLGNDASYQALALVCLVYLVSLSLMVRNTSRGIRAAINLRFENAELLGQLRAKTDIAVAAQREAEQANAAKSKFLAAASHDLRQPVHAQGLFLDVLSRTELSPGQRDLLNNAKAASSASSEMLSSLLDFSRIEAGVIEPRPQATRLQALLNKIESELAPQADAKGIVYRSRETSLVAQTDPILLDLILRNLVSNAIRYTHKGGVLVACRRRGTEAVLEVWDTGIGIAPEHRDEVFREFHQLGNPERDRRKGLGLGLAIAKGLAQTLGHPLSLASVAGRGSVFRLRVPLSNAVIEPEVHPATQDLLRKRSARILVIDDDETVRAAMLPLLLHWGCVCEAAESIEAAMTLARARAPDLIISDYRLREQRTGMEAISAVREVCGASLPALLITGDTAPQRLREAQATGLPLLHKPVSPEQLYRRMVQLLEPAV